MDAQSLRKPALGLLFLLASCEPVKSPDGKSGETLPFHHDDYPRALAEAKAKHKPLFVDAWAPWCHSCLSMQAFVLNDPKLAPIADDYVWLSIDTEKESSAEWVKHFPNEVFPTLWVIDADKQEPILKWGGTATAPELLRLLRTVKDGNDPGTVAFLRGTHEQAQGNYDDAEKSYRAALNGTKEPSARGRASEGIVSTLAKAEKFPACAEEAASLASTLEPGTSRATVLVMGLDCALEGNLDGYKLRAMAARAVQDPDPRTLPDDRSGMYEALVESAKKAGDTDAVKAMAARWATFLEGEASSAHNPTERAVYDPHRLEAYIALGEAGRAVPMLEQSEKDFPNDYNPPARLALAHKELGELETAKNAIDRAASKVYGPRSLRVFSVMADIAKARNRPAEEKAALEQGLARTANTEMTAGQKKLRASLQKRLADLKGSATL